MKHVFQAKTKFVDLTEGDTLNVRINEAQAAGCIFIAKLSIMKYDYIYNYRIDYLLYGG